MRFAPSPTGYLHVGGARTAIYNELLRKSLGGEFILRIEDTDQQRSDAAMIEQICNGLSWLGVHWDEGPFLQSQGVERHRQTAAALLQDGKAYRCFRTPEELDEARQDAQKRGETLRYRDYFEPATKEEQERRAAAGESFAVRFRMPDSEIRFSDFVRGDVVFPAEALDDFIILRSDGSPTYHLSVVCDDVEMRITHVIRGDDHLSNTPKHVGLFQALGAPLPVFGHLPLILGPDKKRLSKRTGATSIEEFRDLGFLPEALYNALALLGWSPGEDRELMTRQEMEELFTVERINAGASVFDRDKLSWINAQYLSGSSLDQLMPHLEPFLAEVGLGDLGDDQTGRLERAVDLHRTRARTLGDLAQMVVPYFRPSLDYDLDLCTKFRKQSQLPQQLGALVEGFRNLESFTAETVEQALRSLAEEVGVKAGALIHPTRMALSSAKAGPSLFDLVVAMGQEASLRHLENFAAFLRQNPIEE